MHPQGQIGGEGRPADGVAAVAAARAPAVVLARAMVLVVAATLAFPAAGRAQGSCSGAAPVSGTALEVSGPGAAQPFLLGPGSWTWEDLAFDTLDPVASYHVYRGAPAGGAYACVFTTPAPQWIPGDTTDPPVDTVFAYVVTAVAPDGRETRAASPPVNLLPDPCP